MHSSNNLWQAERDILDMRALLIEVDDRRRVILEQSFHEASWDAVFDEARLMAQPLDTLRRELQTRYCEIVSLIRSMNGEAGA